MVLSAQRLMPRCVDDLCSLGVRYRRDCEKTVVWSKQWIEVMLCCSKRGHQSSSKLKIIIGRILPALHKYCLYTQSTTRNGKYIYFTASLVDSIGLVSLLVVVSGIARHGFKRVMRKVVRCCDGRSLFVGLEHNWLRNTPLCSVRTSSC